MSPQRMSLADGRLHFSHGPIDLLIQADGEPEAVAHAHDRAWQRFETVLVELVGELPAIRSSVREHCPVRGAVAMRMWQACHPHRDAFITPMAAVAGAVADEILSYYTAPGIVRAAVNNGGDIALHLSADASYRVGLCTEIDAATAAAVQGALHSDGDVLITAGMPVRGIATSGRRGRSFSLGIADSVTVLAASAAQADAAATMIANAVNIDDARILRRPANTLKDDSDLGSIPVTVDVPALDPECVERALRAGFSRAHNLHHRGLIHAAVLVCQGHAMQIGSDLHSRVIPSPPRQGWEDARTNVHGMMHLA